MLKILRSLLAVVLLLSVVSFALARGAPSKSTFVQQAAVEQTAPVVTSVPPMTAGYDVILNLNQASNLYKSVGDTSPWLRLRTPVDWRSQQSDSTGLDRSPPERVLLA